MSDDRCISPPLSEINGMVNSVEVNGSGDIGDSAEPEHGISLFSNDLVQNFKFIKMLQLMIL